jgi:hypothetical protein
MSYGAGERSKKDPNAHSDKLVLGKAALGSILVLDRNFKELAKGRCRFELKTSEVSELSQAKLVKHFFAAQGANQLVRLRARGGAYARDAWLTK